MRRWAVDRRWCCCRDVQVLADLVDHLRLRRLALLGQSHGAPMAATYAADHPRGVSHLVLYGMTRFREEIDERWAALRALLLADWQVGSLAMASVMLAARPVRRSPRSLDCGGAVSARR